MNSYHNDVNIFADNALTINCVTYLATIPMDSEGIKFTKHF